MKTADEVNRRLVAGLKRAVLMGNERAYLGIPTGISGGKVTYDFTGLKPGRTRARLVRASDDAVTGFIDVINHRVPRRPDIRVIIDVNADGEYYVVDVDGTYTLEGAGTDVAENLSVGPHTHRIGGGLEDPVEDRRFLPGLVHVFEGMEVYVEPFFYSTSSGLQYFAGGAIDLTTYIPTTTDYWGWVMVAFDTTGGTVTAYSGTEYASKSSLTVSDLISIDPGSDLPLAGVQCNEAMTAIEAESSFQEARQFLGAGGTSYPEYVSSDGSPITAGGQFVTVG